MPRISRAALLGALALAASSDAQAAPDAEEAEAVLPPVVITTPAKPAAKQPARQPPKPSAARANRTTARAKSSSPVRTPPPRPEPARPEASPEPSPAVTAGGTPAPGSRSQSLTTPSAAEARAEIETTPGGVDLVPATEYKASTPAATVKDVLDYVPGVFVQPKWGEDSRLSIRGSGLSRNFHLRSIQLYQDGIPLNTADGYGDFQEIDPSAYRYVEVYKGANALRYGANALGGAINFVTTTGHDASIAQGALDAGSFGFKRAQASSGTVAGAFDSFVTASLQEQDGFREHSDGDSFRGSANIGARLSPNAETRFYLNGASVDQRIPGSVTKEIALTDPEQAAFINVLNDWQRNIDTIRVANKTTLRMAPGTLIEFGSFGLDRHLMHPIFEWLDYEYRDYGGFVRLFDEGTLLGRRNRFLIGTNLHNGEVDAEQFVNVLGDKGALTFRARDQSENVSAYFENAFYVAPRLALIGGGQFLHATRDRKDLFLSDGDGSGDRSFDLFSPKGGVLFEIAPEAQLFANVSKSVEVPSFGEGFSGASVMDVKEQTAITYEIGTRGRRPRFTWDLALYRAEIDDELQCLDLMGFSDFCVVVNADQTVHQGVELGFGAAVFEGIFARGVRPDQIWLHAAYTYNDFFFDDDASFGDNELPGAPHHFIRAELLYKHPSGVFLGPNVEWVPEAYFVDNANTVTTEPYALLGLKLGYDAGGRFSAYLEGRNLTNETYIASVSIAPTATLASTLFEPGNGRSVYAGLKMRW